MFRSIFGAFRSAGLARCSNTNLTQKYLDLSRWRTVESIAQRASFVQPCTSFHHLTTPPVATSTAQLTVAPFNYTVLQTQARTLTKYSRGKGKRKTVKAVLKRFYRLDWGGWIRTRCGRHKHLWRKSSSLRRRLRQHVFVNSTQSWLLDKMVTSYWRKPKYYVDDPYEPYHTREEFSITRKKPAQS